MYGENKTMLSDHVSNVSAPQLRERSSRHADIAGMERTSSSLFRATAEATFGVVTTMRKLNKKLLKLNRALLNPTAARGPEPSVPTRAAGINQYSSFNVV
jgi:hypothetical protein